jgi:hypothetical protein
MPNTITATTLHDGPRNLVQLINITGDESGNESATVLVDRSAHTPDGTELVVEKIEGLLSGFSATLLFDATADLAFVSLSDGDWFCHDWRDVGGISSNKAGAGATGDILITTAGLESGATDAATFILHMRKA